ncbi:MAG TPA: FAD:protein FMN transferase [Devosia sp.]|jgi:thiamine biosynthesis lipoprotein|nr:FAD:protein FMN transferase [Devosia sp.]
MRSTRLIMGMPIAIEVVGDQDGEASAVAFAYFGQVDARFSPYKPDSELSCFGRREIAFEAISGELREVLELSELTARETNGYFGIRRPDGRIDPSGLVKGWAIRNAARGIEAAGFCNYLIDAGGDVQCRGHNEQGQRWRVGIRNPFDMTQIVKVVMPGDGGVATSGTYVRGQHIYDPHVSAPPFDGVASLTVVGPDVFEADRFATAAFAMGGDGVAFLEMQPGLEAYSIGRDGVATVTSGFERYVVL